MPPLVSLVGAGPGDPSLLTLAAVRAIAEADVVLYDALVHPAVLEHARRGAELVFVGKRAGHDGTPQASINDRLVAEAHAGRRVCRLKGGDPFLFGRGSEEAEVLAREGIAFEVVPGVTSALGATAYAGIPLTHRELSSSVAFVTSSEHAAKSQSAHDWAKLATATQTLVIFMGVRRIGDEMARLIAHGRAPDTPAAAIEWGTRSGQRVVAGCVADLAGRCADADLGAPAIVVVGDVVSLYPSLAWWHRQPLIGRRIVVTRARHQSSELSATLSRLGAEPVPFPAITIAPPTDAAPLAAAIDTLDTYDAVVWTSANGVDAFFTALGVAGRDARALGRSKLVAIGPGTSAALQAHGLRADAVATEFIGESAADATIALFGRPESAAGRRVLVARAEVARAALPDRLAAAGMRVEVVAAYRTIAEAHDGDAVVAMRTALAGGQIDAVTFTSTSTVHRFCDALGEAAASLLAPVVVATIGPVTSEAARARGLAVAVEAPVYSTRGLVDALVAHYERASHRET